MRKLVLVLCALFVVAMVGTAWAQDAYVSTPEQVKWLVHIASTAGYADSSTKTLSMVGTTAIPDTTNAIDTADWAWGGLPMAAGTSPQIGRIYLTSANTCASVDTVFLAQDVSPDGSKWSCGPYVGYGCGNTAGTDQCITAPIIVSTAGGTAGSTVISSMARYMRFRVRPDGNTAAVFTAAKFYVSALKNRWQQ